VNDHLRRAMAAVDNPGINDDDMAAPREAYLRRLREGEGDGPAALGLAAVSSALVVQPDDDDRRKPDEEARAKADAEAQRQHSLDAALADVVEMVARHRARLGRKSCSAHDGATIRKIFDLLRGLTPGMEE
jgi:hypothetical protein